MCLSPPLPHDAQRDTEEADIEKERQQQQKGPAAQAEELEVGVQGVPALCLSFHLICCPVSMDVRKSSCTWRQAVAYLVMSCLPVHSSVTARLVTQHAPRVHAFGTLQELTQIYVSRGLDRELARRVAEQLTEKDVIRAHARDELGIDIDELANPLQAGVVSALAFTAGGFGWWSGGQPLTVQDAMTRFCHCC